MTQTEAIAKFLKRISDRYKQEQQDKDIRASGRSARSLREVTEPKGGKLFGSGYFHFQKVGRRPGKMPPIDAIMQWIEDKGIAPEKGDVRSFAFAIARKIAKSGTDIFTGKRPGLTVQDEIKEGRKVLAVDIARTLKQELIDKLKKARRETEAAQK